MNAASWFCERTSETQSRKDGTSANGEENVARYIIHLSYETNITSTGWDPGSYGYHGDDGFLFESTGKGKPYGPTYTKGDTIGCIVNFMDNTMSFTKNGILIGVAFRDLKPDVPLYPTVGFRTHGESMQINFGETLFKFDIEGYIL
ncbi:Ran-binding protein 9, partial [Rhizoclosmatium hyalinum]